MSLRELAEADLAFTIEDPVGGFGWPCVLLGPDGTEYDLTTLSQDIAAVADPDSGVGVKGRVTTVSFRRSSLPLGVEVVQEEDRSPWLVRLADSTGKVFTYKIYEADDDATLGVLVCHLQPYSTVP